MSQLLTTQHEALTKQAPDPAALLDVREVAALLRCSVRHVYRMADRGDMPAPVRCGALVRWPRALLLDWINGGCRPVK
jgi:excisionase family DNA binding protein